jgi:HSP20 family protein
MSSLIRWDPFSKSLTLREAMERMFDENFMRPFGGWQLAEGDARALALDVSETDETLIVEASLPGINPEDVNISISSNILTIKGDREEEKEAHKGHFHIHERRYGSVHRSINLPVQVDAAKAEASFDKGVLKLTLPKKESEKSTRIEVKVK